jgi:hypothetical protein
MIEICCGTRRSYTVCTILQYFQVVKISVAEPHHFIVGPASGRKNYAAPAQALTPLMSVI